MILDWRLLRDGKAVQCGTLTAKGFDAVAEDKLIPAHPEWLASDELEVSSKHATWRYRVGGWRHSDPVAHA